MQNKNAMEYGFAGSAYCRACFCLSMTEATICEGSALDDGSQLVQECFSALKVLRKHEWVLLFSHGMFMQHHRVVTKVLELECLDFRHDLVTIVVFPEDAEIQCKDGKIGIYRQEAMVAAFIHENDVVAEFHPNRICDSSARRISLNAMWPWRDST